MNWVLNYAFGSLVNRLGRVGTHTGADALARTAPRRRGISSSYEERTFPFSWGLRHQQSFSASCRKSSASGHVDAERGRIVRAMARGKEPQAIQFAIAPHLRGGIWPNSSAPMTTRTKRNGPWGDALARGSRAKLSPSHVTRAGPLRRRCDHALRCLWESCQALRTRAVAIQNAHVLRPQRRLTILDRAVSIRPLDGECVAPVIEASPRLGGYDCLVPSCFVLHDHLPLSMHGNVDNSLGNVKGVKYIIPNPKVFPEIGAHAYEWEIICRYPDRRPDDPYAGEITNHYSEGRVGGWLPLPGQQP